MHWSLVVLLLWPLALAAQTPPAHKTRSRASAVPFPIESIIIEGNQDYSREQILAVAGLKVGQKAADKDFKAAYNRLLATGAFSSVGYRSKPAPDGRGYVLTLQVAEAGPLFPVRFEGLGVPDAQIEALLKRTDPLYGPKIPATQEILNRYTQVIEKYLAAANRHEKVMGKLEPDDNGQLAVFFRSAAPLPVVARVQFTNNAVVPQNTLVLAIHGIAVGMPYREARFRQFLETSIRPLYEARGRVRVAFPEIKTEPEKNVSGLLVTVKVDEGASYSLGAVAVDGTGLAPSETLKLAGLKKGNVFNSEAIQAGITRIESRMRHDGYLDVNSTSDRRINDAAKTVALTIRVDRGPQYVFGKLNIDGLDIISEPEIRKQWAMKAGQPFDADYPDYFLNRIREEGIFENLGQTNAVVKRDDENHTAEVTLIFRGEKPKPAPTR